nr:protein CHUP1, chloroplastic-like [Tanacetum cinerariifolium]
MQEDERKGSVGISSEIESNLCKLKDLEAEVDELRKSNNILTVEKAELLQMLQRVHMLDTSVLKDDTTGKLREESKRLKKQNKELKNEIKQLQADRCSDVEELVYLKWINTCLRSQNSNLTDFGEVDEPYKKNNKFFRKLVKFLRGKDESTPQHHIHLRDHGHSRNSSSEDILSYSI